MLGKSEKKYEAIIEAATDLFRELGYERTTMDAINKRIGGSKTTIYSYFKSKEPLMFGGRPEVEPEIAVSAAVAVFLRAYGVQRLDAKH